MLMNSLNIENQQSCEKTRYEFHSTQLQCRSSHGSYDLHVRKRHVCDVWLYSVEKYKIWVQNYSKHKITIVQNKLNELSIIYIFNMLYVLVYIFLAVNWSNFCWKTSWQWCHLSCSISRCELSLQRITPVVRPSHTTTETTKNVVIVHTY